MGQNTSHGVCKPDQKLQEIFELFYCHLRLNNTVASSQICTNKLLQNIQYNFLFFFFDCIVLYFDHFFKNNWLPNTFWTHYINMSVEETQTFIYNFLLLFIEIQNLLLVGMSLFLEAIHNIFMHFFSYSLSLFKHVKQLRGNNYATRWVQQ